MSAPIRLSVHVAKEAGAHAPQRPRILVVDDEPRVLEGLVRTLHRHYHVVTAPSGEVAVALLRDEGPFAVVVSDMRMPGISGAQFLALSRDIAPDTVRVLLTGYADVQSAVAAVNDGQIFRFLQKPCSPEVLEATLGAATEQHRIIVSEHALLEQTLRGSIEVLTDVLAMVSPVAFARAIRLKRTVSDLALALAVPEVWPIEVAALLSQLGAINVPVDVLQRFYRDEHLNADERAQIGVATEGARQIIGHIPRLEVVCEILRYVHEERAPLNAMHSSHATPVSPKRSIGARLLGMAMDFDRLESRGLPPVECLDAMEGRREYDAVALAVLRRIKCASAEATGLREVRLCEVRVGMVFARDVVAANGLVLIGRGQQATLSLVRRIQSFWLDLPLKGRVEVFEEGKAA